MSHQLRYAARSDRGLLRSNNQDSVYAGDRLLIVADGMGGHAAGDLASRVVVAAFAPLDAQPPGPDLTEVLRRALLEGNDAIAELVAEDPELDGMGTTATALLFDGNRVGLGHIGDSRAYLYRNGVLHQLSHDDTFVQSLVDDGRITEDEATNHPQRNLLLRALNGTTPEPAITEREISLGDRFLVCSDGLSGVVAAEAIADALADPDAETSADRLIELALVAGGPDNVTVIVADVIDVGAPSEPDVPAEPVDPDATGPIRPIHETQRMPRIPLPADGGDHDDADTDPVDGAPSDDGGDPARGGSAEQVATEAPARPEVRWHRRGALALAIAVLLGVITGGTLLWARTHYYVGADDGTVVVFRGVNGSVLGVSLSSVEENSCTGAGLCPPIAVDDLEQGVRDQVIAGIEVSSLDEARALMTRLSERRLPPCDETPGGAEALGTGTSGTASSMPPTTNDQSPASAPTTTSPPAATPPGTAGTSGAATGRSEDDRVGHFPPRIHRTNRLHDGGAIGAPPTSTAPATAAAPTTAADPPHCREPG